MARRLVEAGSRCVTLAFSRWDHHGDNFGACRQDMPLLDQGALGPDRRPARPRARQGRLGRRLGRVRPHAARSTLRPAATTGRNVSCALLVGGGMRTGQVIGSTDRLGGEAKDRPVHFQEVFATLYHRLGIDVNTVTVQRPHAAARSSWSTAALSR